MIGKRGDIGQTISSVIVFFAVFFLMVIFVSVVGNIANVKNLVYGGQDNGNSSKLEAHYLERAKSRALLDMFLSEEIKINDGSVEFSDTMRLGGYVDPLIWDKFVNKKEMDVYDALLLAGIIDIQGRDKITLRERIAIYSPIEKLFDEHYGCDGANSFYLSTPISTGLGESPGTRILYGYPEERWIGGKKGFPIKLPFNNGEKAAYPFNDKAIEDGFYRMYLKDKPIEIAVRGARTC